MLFVTIVFDSQSRVTGREMIKQAWLVSRAWLPAAGAILVLAIMATWGVNRNEAISASVPVSTEKPQAAVEAVASDVLELLFDREWNPSTLAGFADPNVQLFDEWFAEEVKRNHTETFIARVRQYHADEEFREKYEISDRHAVSFFHTW